jgi:hypothetical protein
MYGIGLAGRTAVLASVAALGTAGAAEARPYPFRDAPLAASASSGRTLAGLTTQFPCRLSDSPSCGVAGAALGRTRRTIRSVMVGWEAGCAASDAYVDGLTVVARPKLRRSGRRLLFRVMREYERNLGDGYSGDLNVTLSGALNRSRSEVAGTFRAVLQVSREGRLVDTCDSGRVDWLAAKGR